MDHGLKPFATTMHEDNDSVLKKLAALSKYDEKIFSNVIAWSGTQDLIELIERLKLDAE